MSGPIVCPKCSGAMITHNRQGVQVEQCGQCRGIFLDFGELESLVQLQLQWLQQQPSAQPQHPPAQQTPGWGAPQQQGYPQQGYGQPGYGKYHKKKGFMGMLFSS